ncbi:SdpI family protein [Flavisolibacter sp. BT320]|nr:SdpI family protein [Flavisolibacter longurius]
MKKTKAYLLAVLLLALSPIAYLAMVYNSLPQQVALHYGTDMKPDRYGDKEELWLVTILLAGVSVFVYGLLTNIQRFDPKRKAIGGSATFNKLAFGLVVFMAALNFVIIASSRGNIDIQRVMFPLMGLLFAFIGNYMNHIKPNYFAGIRLPWTLSSDENWRRTHQLAGKIWFAGGVLIALAGLVLSSSVAFPVFIGALVVMVLIPVVYSYRLFKQQV